MIQVRDGARGRMLELAREQETSMRPTVLLFVASCLLLTPGCMGYGLYGRAYGTSAYGSSYQVVGPAYGSSTTVTTTTTAYGSPYAVGPSTIGYSSYGYGPTYGAGPYGYGPSYGAGPYGPTTYGTGPYGTYTSYDTSGYGYGVTSAYGTPAGYGSATAPSTYGSYAAPTGVTVVVTPPR